MILPTGRARDVFGTTNNGKPHGVGSGLDAFLKVQRQLNEQPQQVLTYTTDAADPAQQYLQVFVLNYSHPQHVAAAVPERVGGAEVPEGTKLPYKPTGQLAHDAGDEVRTKVRIDSGQGGPTAYLPVPYAPVDLRIGGVGWEELEDSLMILSPVQGPVRAEVHGHQPGGRSGRRPISTTPMASSCLAQSRPRSATTPGRTPTSSCYRPRPTRGPDSSCRPRPISRTGCCPARSPTR